MYKELDMLVFIEPTTCVYKSCLPPRYQLHEIPWRPKFIPNYVVYSTQEYHNYINNNDFHTLKMSLPTIRTLSATFHWKSLCEDWGTSAIWLYNNWLTRSRCIATQIPHIVVQKGGIFFPITLFTILFFLVIRIIWFLRSLINELLVSNITFPIWVLDNETYSKSNSLVWDQWQWILHKF